VCCDVVDDVRALVPELAARLGVALANANAYEREHRVAMTFQQAALEPGLPDVPGVDFSALYQAARADASIGGDWYDAFRLPDGRIVMSVGDVAGSGLDAAVTMGSVRQSIRTAVLINPDPSAVVEAVDRIVRAMGPDRFVTAFVCVLDPVCGELTYANAGHPPALLRRPNGELVELGSGDLPLGLRQRDTARRGAITVEPGSLIVAYTDGLTEFERDPLGGYAKLLEAVRRCDIDDVAHAIFDGVAGGEPARDDVAILTVAYRHALSEVDNDRRASRWVFNANDGERAHRVRYQVLERLREAGFSAKDLPGAELVFGELIGNVFRYAGGPVEVILDISGDAPVLHVLDSGHGFEFRPRLPELYAEHGRGLFLVNAFADEFSIERRSTGGSHARVVLIGTTRVRGAAPTMTRTRL
ncbi:MAG TPA: ATP-binding SpoIIE family protein phosphatase, partial [Candidatus Acidoferrum sp.]|nr:ATP-binding SpoIIE family protein phosphatase [Candidatus Acidoferrum sp.]